MITPIEAARSGLQAFQHSVQVAAQNLANLRTEGFRPSRVSVSEGPGGGVTTHVVPEPSLSIPDPTALQHHAFIEQSGTDLLDDMLALLLGKHGFAANLETLRTADTMLGTVLNLRR